MVTYRIMDTAFTLPTCLQSMALPISACLDAHAYVETISDIPPTLPEMLKMVARQGSYVGRNGDGHPGIVSIWVGLQRVMDYAIGWIAFGPESIYMKRETCG
ncbi:MAG: IS4 family transposase [bacterium]